jgi:peptidoglycan hydrolase-like protein with peptidoglycan-binding domain
MKTKIAILILIAWAAPIHADQTIANAQQVLKDQGFYYGEITGEKNTDTTAAIRRYQIRNGLPITGELNDETLSSLRSAPSASTQPAATNAPSPNANKPELHDDSSRETAAVTPAPAQSAVVPPQNQPDSGVYPSNFATVPPQTSGLLAGTPYENSPPQVQRDIVVSAQMALLRRGFYRGEIDGVYNSTIEFSLRAYQSRVGLPVTGQLNLETLAALELLPGAKAPVYRPRRRVWREPPVRGEWIRP